MRIPRSCKVRLYIRIRCADGKSAYATPAWNKNHTLREGYAIVDATAEAHPEGVYYLRYLNGARRVWHSIGADADVALTALHNKEHDLRGRALGRVAPEVDVPEREEAPSITVAEAFERYIYDVRRFRSVKTKAACTNMLGVFCASYGSRLLTNIKREDIINHTFALSDKGLALVCSPETGPMEMRLMRLMMGSL